MEVLLQVRGDLQRIGVRMDEIVKLTISGIKSGKDELLARAIEIIEDNKDDNML